MNSMLVSNDVAQPVEEGYGLFSSPKSVVLVVIVMRFAFAVMLVVFYIVLLLV